MNKRVLTIVAAVSVLIVAGAGAWAFANQPMDAAPAVSAGTPGTSDGAGTPDDDGTAENAGSSKNAGTPGLLEYSEEAVASAEGRVLLFFHADWCPRCIMLEKDIVDKGVPEGVTILLVDFDDRQDLRQRYGVTLQTTLVEVDAQGEALQSYTAYEKPTLEAVVEAML